MATGSLNAQGVWIYGEDDSETTFSALLNKLGTSVSADMKGRIAQIVFATYSTQTVSSTSTFVTTGLTANITPTKANSKIIVLVSQNGVSKFNNTTSAVDLRLMRGATALSNFGIGNALISVATDLFLGSSSVVYVDSPGTTSAVTYSTQFRNPANIAAAFVQRSGAESTITLIEVTN